MEKFNSKIIVWLLHIHITNEVARFWVFAGEPLIQHCQLRGDGRQSKINFQILLFFNFSCLVLPTNHLFWKEFKFGVLSWRPISATLSGYVSVPMCTVWLTQRFPLSQLCCCVTKPVVFFSKIPVALKHLWEQVSPYGPHLCTISLLIFWRLNICIARLYNFYE